MPFDPKTKTQKVLVVSGFVRGPGLPPAVPGDVLEFPNAFAREVVAARQAIYADDAPPKEEQKPEPETDPKKAKAK